MIRAIDFDDQEIQAELRFETSRSLKCFPGLVIGFQHPLRNNKRFHFEFYSPGVFRRNCLFDRAFRDVDDYNHNLRRTACQGYLSPDIRPSDHQVYFELLEKWSHDCTSHGKCQTYRSDSKIMPKRILDVQMDPPLLNNTVDKPLKYITLSHCSEIDFLNCSLTLANLQTFKTGMISRKCQGFSQIL